MSGDEEQREQIRELKNDSGGSRSCSSSNHQLWPRVCKWDKCGVEKHIYNLVQSTVLACVDSLSSQLAV